MKKKQDIDKSPSDREGKTIENSKVNEEEERALDVPKNQNPSSSKSNPPRDSTECNKHELQLQGRVARVIWEWDLNEKIGSDNDESNPDDDSSRNQLVSTATQNDLSDPKVIQAAATLPIPVGGKQFLFGQELTAVDVSGTHLSITRRDAETHFPPLNTPNLRRAAEANFPPPKTRTPRNRTPRTYRKEVLRFTDKRGKIWHMTIEYKMSIPGYVLNSRWKEFVDEHRLESGDFIRFYRPVQTVDTKHYLIEYVKTKEARISYPQRANEEDTALFEQELTRVDVAVRSPGFVIPRMVVEKYYYPNQEKIPPEGIGFKEEEEWILLSDGDWITRMEFDPYVEGYKTMGNRWREYVNEHGLEAGDLIRFYRPLPGPNIKYRFLIRYAKAKMARVVVGSTSGSKVEEEEKAKAKEISKEGTHTDTEGSHDHEKKTRGEEKTDIQQEGRGSPSSSAPAEGSGKKTPLGKDIALPFKKRLDCRVIPKSKSG